MTLTDTLVNFSLGSLAPTARARAIVRLSLLDWAAVTHAGSSEPVAKHVRTYALHNGGRAESTLVGSNLKLPAATAALVNGTTSHALDYDDTHFDYIGHPSVTVIPAVLAVGESIGASDAACLDAALVGLEVATRVGVWLGRSHYSSGFHITATAGSVGATAAAARLLDLTPVQAGHALSLVASRASGLRAQFGSMAKPWQAGLAASNGVEAALLAKLGVEASTNVIEAPQGLAATQRGEFNGHAFDNLGTAYRFEEVTHKFHACCHGTHAMIDALRSVKAERPIDPDTVRKVTVTVTPQFENVCNQLTPQTGLEAKFSFRLLAAMTLHAHDTASLDSYSAAVCVDPKLTSLRDRVDTLFDPSMPETAAKVRIDTPDGVHVGEADLLDPTFLADTGAREARVLAKAASLLGTDLTNYLCACVDSAEQATGSLAARLLSTRAVDRETS
ncbi:MAG: MmgE/PrpD family protein [Pseudomonadota bacterium]